MYSNRRELWLRLNHVRSRSNETDVEYLKLTLNDAVFFRENNEYENYG